MTASKRQKTGLNTVVIICLKNLSPIYKQITRLSQIKTTHKVSSLLQRFPWIKQQGE